MKISIPDDYIEDAKEYAIIPSDYPGMHLTIGGKIMLNLVVKEQMEIDMILLTTGVTGERCLILVGYKLAVVQEMIKNAKAKVDKLIAQGMLDPKSGL